MGFKRVTDYIEEKKGKFFTLTNDGDYEDVIFLYRSVDDALVASVHYIKSSGYSGYAHCCGAGCPACNYGDRGIRKEDKIFIPLFNLSKGVIEYWDRNARFQQVMEEQVFRNYPNPSEYVFRITRHGAPGDRQTRYMITVAGKNTMYTYEKILADFHLSFPDSYSEVCRELTIPEMNTFLNGGRQASDIPDYGGYVPIPRAASTESIDPGPDINVPTQVYSMPPADLPSADLPPFVESGASATPDAAVSDGIPEYVPGGTNIPPSTPVVSESFPDELGAEDGAVSDEEDFSDLSI